MPRAELYPYFRHFRSIAMKVFRVDANIVALSGIAIAIGTIVDMGIIVTENILRRMHAAGLAADRFEVILKASAEVGGAVVTAVSSSVTTPIARS